MDVNHFRIAVMLAGFVLFLMLMVHTYSPAAGAKNMKKPRCCPFAATQPLVHWELPPAPVTQENKRE